MRTFILRAQKARTDRVDPDHLPEAGRMDIVCHCIANALWVSNNVRTDTVIHVVLEGGPTPPRCVTFDGATIQGLQFDERGISLMINEALKKGKNLSLNEMLAVSPGLYVSKKSFEQLVKEAKGEVIYLHKKGEDIREHTFKGDVTFVFGDYIGIPSKTEKYLDRLGAHQVSVGPTMLFANHCIVLVHNALDRNERK